MKLKSFFTRFFTFGEVLEKINSPINGEIKVVDDMFGDRSMIIGGVSQSGGLVTKLWKTAFTRIANCKLQIANCLILGLGCGNAAKIVSEKYPECKVTGIEIDPKVIDIGKKYFKLGRIENLEIIINDAIKIIHDSKFMIHDSNYDLILVDLYLGQEFPKEAENDEFINKIKKILNKNGVVIFNRLSYGKYQNNAYVFSEKLKDFFSSVSTKKAVTNLLIFCSSQRMTKKRIKVHLS